MTGNERRLMYITPTPFPELPISPPWTDLVEIEPVWVCPYLGTDRGCEGCEYEECEGWLPTPNTIRR